MCVVGTSVDDLQRVCHWARIPYIFFCEGGASPQIFCAASSERYPLQDSHAVNVSTSRPFFCQMLHRCTLIVSAKSVENPHQAPSLAFRGPDRSAPGLPSSQSSANVARLDLRATSIQSGGSAERALLDGAVVSPRAVPPPLWSRCTVWNVRCVCGVLLCVCMIRCEAVRRRSSRYGVIGYNRWRGMCRTQL